MTEPNEAMLAEAAFPHVEHVIRGALVSTCDACGAAWPCLVRRLSTALTTAQAERDAAERRGEEGQLLARLANAEAIKNARLSRDLDEARAALTKAEEQLVPLSKAFSVADEWAEKRAEKIRTDALEEAKAAIKRIGADFALGAFGAGGHRAGVADALAALDALAVPGPTEKEN